MSEFLQISTTTPSEQMARQIAAVLVEQRLAACVQVQGPIHSVYRWQGKVEEATEWLCTAKTHAVHLPNVEKAICQLHDYECPEIIAVPIVGGSTAYLTWLEEQLA
ncbi:MAG: divalent-cation tolerance protein CutA [Pirellulales bacterium]|nr:divalent-cation tolerance protein CutA [Pirellulales bacterium]